MRINVYLWTVLFSSLTFILSLKILDWFSFMKLSPIGWAKKWHIFSDSHSLVKWFILWIFVVIIAAVLFAIAELLKKVRMDIVAIFLAIVIVWLIEWSVQHTFYIRHFSIPLAVVIGLHLLWIFETATYHAKMRNLESRNKLPQSV